MRDTEFWDVIFNVKIDKIGKIKFLDVLDSIKYVVMPSTCSPSLLSPHRHQNQQDPSRRSPLLQMLEDHLFPLHLKGYQEL
mmetsp:Transcript_6059/g.15014  ORF Transcript_6059/g.15014 Transcript_6059/m.15014 type:complete len:81 (-) Transcript_6059:508-750(-)